MHGQGLDELTVAGDNQVVALQDGRYASFTSRPEDAGLPRAPIEAIRGGDAGAQRRRAAGVAAGRDRPYRDTVLLNAAAALIVAGRAADLREGVALAGRSIDPARRWRRWRRCGARPRSQLNGRDARS